MEKLGTYALTLTTPKPRLQLSFPMPLSRALHQEGYNAVDLFLTEDGIFLKPLSLESGALKSRGVQTLPSWASDE